MANVTVINVIPEVRKNIQKIKPMPNLNKYELEHHRLNYQLKQ